MSALGEAMERLREARLRWLTSTHATEGDRLSNAASAVLAAYDATADGAVREPPDDVKDATGGCPACEAPIWLNGGWTCWNCGSPVVAAGGATPDPAERVWRCASPVARVDPLHACGPTSPHTAFGCGWVPSEEGTTPR